jgi:hypothetical protein
MERKCNCEFGKTGMVDNEECLKCYHPGMEEYGYGVDRDKDGIFAPFLLDEHELREGNEECPIGDCPLRLEEDV